MRIDRLLCNLRFARTRSLAARLVSAGHLRRNGQRVTRPSHDIAVGDVLTVPWGAGVRLVEILSLPERRGGAPDAQRCYRLLGPEAGGSLDPAAQTDIGGWRYSSPGKNSVS